jgi:hypothetical protein
MSRRTLAAAAVALTLLGVTGCSGDAPVPTPGEKYDSFEKISKAVGCTELLDDEQALPGEVETKTCVYHNTGFSIQHFPNGAKRDSAVAQGLASGEVAYLILDENWALQGQPDDVIAVRDNLGAGELITPDGASSDEPTEAGPQVVALPYGKLATNQETGQQVRIAKIQANQSVISNVKENPNWNYENVDEQYLDLKASKGDRFWIVHVAWKNVSKKPRITEGDFVLLSENGTEYNPGYQEEAAVLERKINGEEDWALNEINPGKGRTIVLIFAVPTNTKVDSVAWAGTEFLQDPDKVYHLKVR